MHKNVMESNRTTLIELIKILISWELIEGYFQQIESKCQIRLRMIMCLNCFACDDRNKIISMFKNLLIFEEQIGFLLF
jgi:hypothetical protein